MGYIVLPQAFRNMLPVLLTQTIILFQDTSLVYVLSVTDFLGAAVEDRATRRPPGRDVLCSPRVVYFVICFAASLLREAAAAEDRHHPLTQREPPWP